MPFDAASAPALEDTTLSLSEAWDIIGGLSTPGKMPWFGWSIPATRCQTGMKLAQTPNSVCSICYAMKGFYVMPNVEAAMERRYQALSDPRFVGAFIRVLRLKYRNSRTYRADGNKENRFRWFDSGDLQSAEMLSKISLIAYGTPEIWHYLPTKEPRLVGKFIQNGGVIPSNLQVKISHPMLGQTFKRAPMGMDYTTAGRPNQSDTYDCPAYQQGGKCHECDACWKPGNINYEAH